MVPFYRLPELHELMKVDCPPAYPSLWATRREIIPALLRQSRPLEVRAARTAEAGHRSVNAPSLQLRLHLV
jgi:fatty acid desaturase